MDMFHAASSQFSTVKQADCREGELSRLYPSLSLDARTGVFFSVFWIKCYRKMFLLKYDVTILGCLLRQI